MSKEEEYELKELLRKARRSEGKLSNDDIEKYIDLVASEDFEEMLPEVFEKAGDTVDGYNEIMSTNEGVDAFNKGLRKKQKDYSTYGGWGF